MYSQSFIGLDLSLNGTGCCLINSDYQVLNQSLISTKTTETVLRLFLNRNCLLDFLKSNSNIKLCCIEGPSFGSKDGGRLFQIGEWTGVVKLLLYELNIPLIIAVPSQLKKYISGTGKDIKKELIMLDIYKKYNLEFRDNNIADAYVLSRIARDYFFLLQENKIPDGIFKYQEEVLKAIYKSYGDQQDKSLL